MRRMNKKGQQLRAFLIAILLFALLTTGFYVIMADMFNFYGTPVSPSFSSFFTYVNGTLVSDTNRQITNISEKVEGSEGLQTVDSPSVTTNVFKAILLPYQAIKTSISTITEIGIIMGIPSWVIAIFASILTVLVLFWILSAVRGKDV